MGLTKGVILEKMKQGVTRNAICPGYVKTPLVEGRIKDQAKVQSLSHEEVIRNVILAASPRKNLGVLKN